MGDNVLVTEFRGMALNGLFCADVHVTATYTFAMFNKITYLLTYLLLT